MTTATVEAPAYWDCEPSLEEGGSFPIALYYAGHLDLDVVLALGIRYFDEEFDHTGGLPERPQHRYLRKIPARDEFGERGGWMMHREQREPGRGASPVTVFRWLTDWEQIPCGGGPRIRCTGPVVAGIPAEQVIDAPSGERYVYLCRAHHRDFDARMKVAREAALAEWKASHAAQ